MRKIVICLEHRVKIALRRLRRDTSDKGLAMRCQIVLLVAKGRSLSLPSGFTGKGTWKVTNRDTKDDHEATVIRIDSGKTVADVVAYFKSHDRNGPPPATAMGGMGDLPAGGSGWMVLNLKPGSYALACFVPDDTGVPHLAMGMISPFQVS